MNLIVNQAKKDLRRHAVVIILWFFLVILGPACLSVRVTTIKTQLLMIGIGATAYFLQAVVLFILIPLIVSDEPLVGSTAFWFTRPISRKTLLAAKTLFITVLLVLMPLFTAIVMMAVNGVDTAHTMLALPELLMRNASVIIPLWLLASFTKNFATYALVGIIGSLIVVQMNAVLSGVFYTMSIIKGNDLITLLQSQRVIGSIFTIICGAGVIVHQYLTRKTTRSCVIAAMALLVILIVPAKFWHWDFMAIKSAGILESNDISVIAHPEDITTEDSQGSSEKKGYNIKCKLNLVGMPPGCFAVIGEPTSAKATFPNSTQTQNTSLRYPVGSMDTPQENYEDKI